MHFTFLLALFVFHICVHADHGGLEDLDGKIIYTTRKRNGRGKGGYQCPDFEVRRCYMEHPICVDEDQRIYAWMVMRYIMLKEINHVRASQHTKL